MENSSKLLLLAGFFMSLNSCVHETDLSDLKAISFATDIQPILAGNCTMSGCHSNDGQGEFSLVSYDEVISNGDITAGDADDSEIYEVISESDADDVMPPPPRLRLSDDRIKIIYLWIEQGAKNN